MDINALIQTERPPISSLVSGLRSDTLFVDDTFQRKLVWTEKQKVRLIETILIGYPMPELYLWQQPANAETGDQRRSIVDGQQRLTTMRQFVANEWPLRKSYLDSDNRGKPFSGKLWKDLADSDKQAFWDYVVNIRIIPNGITRDTIISLFKRLNETDKSLNPQEIRNAEFNGKLIKAAEEITAFTFWEKYDVFSAAQIRRMADIEFASSLLVFLRRGSVQENNKLLNEMYDLYNDKYPESKSDTKEVSEFLVWLDEIIEKNPHTEDMLTKPVHIFTLFGVKKASSSNSKLRSKLTGAKIADFVSSYELGKQKNGAIEQYREAAQARTRSKSSRDSRYSALIRWLLES